MKKDLYNINYAEETSNMFTEVKEGVGVYLRLSSGSQSLMLQEDAIKNWISQSGISWVDIEVYNEGVLPAYQKIVNHPELMRLLKAIESGQIKVVIVYSWERFTREFSEFMEIVGTFMRYKVKVVCVGEKHLLMPF